jgi:hypothetical protein
MLLKDRPKKLSLLGVLIIAVTCLSMGPTLAEDNISSADASYKVSDTKNQTNSENTKDELVLKPVSEKTNLDSAAVPKEVAKDLCEDAENSSSFGSSPGI